MVESIIGIRGKDFVLLGQDANTTKYGIHNMKFDTNRLFKLTNLIVGGYSTNKHDQQHAQFYSIDYLGAIILANVVAHGFCQFFALTIGDHL
ncbi:unnamed protein product [Rotaria sordida]|uniref:Uncharacterized protein n=1 Tax=Rotaria sordida TaxID=392033 RepID=A0A814XEF2_9BILA|nr:unnamed protein product [Rotaria sordida]CAF1215336.1 unnamed protein product [Rotaria sordida]